ncbi:hypothetical protein NC661_19305 [Aquibacillus koreensis]|uniref:Uncharacterized protein n=1 Tax=Aquibacillus koreensis TaxID=279446 RepID=A0A9X3WSA8_9BACI|nr:hypothetical protein [Aquibacillus koreensis]MCT2535339.1 hypothetical protein [Aquibacillus koreensis]MDC3422504.1 hypothetical protein [Aquibacillus koreensis]
MKKFYVLFGCFLLLVLLSSVYGPYNLYHEFNETKTLKQFISEDNTFNRLEVVEIDYRGSDTYFIEAKDENETRNFIVMNYHSSVMNGHWKVFEQVSIGNYY